MISTAKLVLLLSAMSTVESNGDPHAFNYHEQAFGILQVRQAAVDDVNRLALCAYHIEDALHPQYAYEIAERYLRIWCAVSNQYSFESAARIWNGGPDGWWKLSTLPYWSKVSAELRRRGIDPETARLDTRDIIVAWPLQQTSPSPAARSAFTLATTAASSSHSDLATYFFFALNASEAKARRSISSPSTIRRSGSKPAPPPASPPPTSLPAKTPPVVVVFEIHPTR